MEVIMKKLVDTIELQRVSDEKFTQYLETLKLGVIKPVAAAVDTVVDYLGINADNVQHMPSLQADNLLAINADNAQHMPSLHMDSPLLINAENVQHMPSLQKPLVFNAENVQHRPSLQLDNHLNFNMPSLQNFLTVLDAADIAADTVDVPSRVSAENFQHNIWQKLSLVTVKSVTCTPLMVNTESVNKYISSHHFKP